MTVLRPARGWGHGSMAAPLSGPRCLSIQSSVVHGVVGNKAAILPLQLRGVTVDPLNSVQLSNHTGYGAVAGQKLSGDDLAALVRGLGANGLLHYTHVLTG